METLYCNSCNRATGFKRALGWGTFFAVIFTGGIWLLILPFYPKRCIICGSRPGVINPSPVMDSPPANTEAGVNASSPNYATEKKCPACAEIIKLEALKCRFCGETFDPDEVKKLVQEREQRFLNDFEVITGRSGEAYCVACGAVSPINGMYFNKKTEKYYHGECLSKKPST